MESKLTWVAITDTFSEVQVQLENSIIDQLINGKYEKDYLHLKNVFWAKDGSNEIEQQSIAGKEWGYSDECFLKIDKIIRIIPLSEVHVAQYYES